MKPIRIRSIAIIALCALALVIGSIWMSTRNKNPDDLLYDAYILISDGHGTNNSYEKAFPLLKQAAEQGHAGSQCLLGLMYLKGRGVAKDYTEALKWLSKAAKQGDPDAQYQLARMYECGNGVVQDKKLAISLYQNIIKKGWDAELSGVSVARSNASKEAAQRLKVLTSD